MFINQVDLFQAFNLYWHFLNKNDVKNNARANRPIHKDMYTDRFAFTHICTLNPTRTLTFIEEAWKYGKCLTDSYYLWRD